jgi:probable rRNA maturation factor
MKRSALKAGDRWKAEEGSHINPIRKLASLILDRARMTPARRIVHVAIDEPYRVEKGLIRAAARCALDAADAPANLALTVQIASAEQVHDLNRRFAGIDSPTDVLSFGPEDTAYATEPDAPPYFGDVIIAYPVAEQQAAAAGLPLEVELQTLAIHGTLHLLGYDHGTAEEKAEMEALQNQALALLDETTR